MKMNLKCWAVILIVTALASWLRLDNLPLRPLHTDEAVHAYKFGQLLQGEGYEYDCNEYHGPTLNYFTLIPAWLAGQDTYASLAEVTIRIIPAFFGIILILLYGFLNRPLGLAVLAWAAILTALSPAMVFYSRYYIQEMLLVCFTLALMVTGYHYLNHKTKLSAVGVGICAGLMFATKETCVITFGSIALAILFTRLLNGKNCRQPRRRFQPTHLIIALAAFGIIAVLFYSSFFSNMPGVVDSVRTFKTYLGRSQANEAHNHPWYYYLKTFIFSLKPISWSFSSNNPIAFSLLSSIPI